MSQLQQSLNHMRGQFVGLLLLIAVLGFGSSVPCLGAGPTLEWVRQFGTFSEDSVEGLTYDGLGNLYISGETWGDLGGPNAGGIDTYLAKFDLAGNQIWSNQFGTTTLDRSFAVAADRLGNVFQSRGPAGDFVITNSDGSGNELWSREPAGIAANGLSADGLGNVYAASTIGRPAPSDDGSLEKFDAAGNLLWARQFGTSDHEQSHIVSADSAENVFVYGRTLDSECFTGCDPIATLIKFDAEGNEYWTRYVESARYVNRGGVVADGQGNVYITGNSNAPIVEPRVHLGYDAFLAKFDAEGNRLWLQEFGTAEFADTASSVVIDGRGNVFVTGTMGDPYLAMFDTHGNQEWLHQFGTPAEDRAEHVVADQFDYVYVTGVTLGDLGGPIGGEGARDVFLAKFRVTIPEPSALVLLGLGGVTVLLRRK